MVDILNLLLLKKYEVTPAREEGEFIDHWLESRRNYERLQRACEKIWSQSGNDPDYDAERAFRVLGQRFIAVCRQETQSITLESPSANL